MASEQPPLVLHIIYALGTGGLENGLIHIINGTPPGRYRHAIVCLTQAEGFQRRLQDEQVAVYELHMRPGTDVSAYRRLRRLVRRLRPDIVHSRNLAPLEAQLATLGLAGVRRVHGEHGRDMADLDGSNRRYRLFRRAMRLLVHHYIAVSQDLAGWLRHSIGVKPDRLTQIYNGVDIQRFQGAASASPALRRQLLPAGLLSAAEDDVLVIGSVGRLAEVKSQHTLLEAVAALRQMLPALAPRLRIVLVGEGVMRDRLQRSACDLGVSDILWMPGDRDDIPELLGCMDLFVLPSLGEGISNTLLEAMASGLPVVASDVGGNPELVRPGQHGELFPVGDAQALAAVLAPLCSDAARRARYGQNARRFVSERFSWPATIDNYLGLYDRLLGRTPAGDVAVATADYRE
ncbi:TIGR03088 family PEP-CTERM/XrtA system glycosyltransferase [Parahaliea mediterranea]|uniref:TIGR03088 family PEP-CTERM/XrtA system glycosyltransferase n=1 Tax=Parahaliea mediterranea TaxID=651086 RepID=UPI000E2E4E7B|nr:TIGR03088 family PEP-CTERM/XrtA system glycosyltransferase [Parahaliea mediterranea]